MTPPIQRGDWLGEYEILDQLRSGGMATLFLGRRHDVAGVSRPVAIKVIHPHLAEDETIVTMFIDEAKISSHISHRNVVYVEKFGVHQGTYFIVMEYVDGCSAEQLLRANSRRFQRLAPDVAVHIVLEAAAGLHAAHETVGEDGMKLGIVHRDVSPSNILLTRDGNVKLIDFGIAKARNRLGATLEGSGLKGKVRYMSPEQAWLRPVDRTADLYALGVVLWELLTNRPLYAGDDGLAILERVRDPNIPPPSSIVPELPQGLDDVLARVLAREPSARFQTAVELRRQLLQVVPGATTLAEDTISNLVVQVREILTPSKPTPSPEDESATTPNRASHPRMESAPRAESSPMLAVGSGVPGSTPGSLVQVQLDTPSRGRPRAWWWLLGTGLAAAIAAAVIIPRLGSSADTMVDAPPASHPRPPIEPPAGETPATGASPGAPPSSAPTGETSASGTPTSGTPASETAPPGETAPKAVISGGGTGPTTGVPSTKTSRPSPPSPSRPPPSRPPPGGKAKGPKAISVDGSVLAVDPPKAPKGKKPSGNTKTTKSPTKSVDVDGTVLAE